MIDCIGKIALSLLSTAALLNMNIVMVKYDHGNPFGKILDSICGLSWFFGFISANIYVVLKIWL